MLGSGNFVRFPGSFRAISDLTSFWVWNTELSVYDARTFTIHSVYIFCLSPFTKLTSVVGTLWRTVFRPSTSDFGCTCFVFFIAGGFAFPLRSLFPGPCYCFQGSRIQQVVGLLMVSKQSAMGPWQLRHSSWLPRLCPKHKTQEKRAEISKIHFLFWHKYLLSAHQEKWKYFLTFRETKLSHELSQYARWFSKLTFLIFWSRS